MRNMIEVWNIITGTQLNDGNRRSEKESEVSSSKEALK